MNRLQQLVRSRSRGGLLAVCVAYSLVIQAVMASIGLGMSAGALLDRTGFVLCSFASDTNAPVQDSDRQKPNPAPRCPFCFIAAQSAGNVATVGKASAMPGVCRFADRCDFGTYWRRSVRLSVSP
jgi:hypothetical protein